MGRIANKRPDGGYDTVVWGSVSQASSIGETQNHNPKVKFSVCYAKSTYMNCVAYGNTDTTQFAASLEKGDLVLCAGLWSERQYTDKDGNPRRYQELVCDIVFPPAALMEAAFRVPLSPESGEDGGAQGSQREEETEPDFELSI